MKFFIWLLKAKKAVGVGLHKISSFY